MKRGNTDRYTNRELREKSTMAARNVYISWTMAFALYWCRMYVLPLRVLFSFHNSNFFLSLSLFLFFYLLPSRESPARIHLMSSKTPSHTFHISHLCGEDDEGFESSLVSPPSSSSPDRRSCTGISFERRTVHLKRCFVHYEADYRIQLVGTRRLLNPLASSESRWRIKRKWENFCCISFSRLYEKEKQKNSSFVF